MTDFNQDSFKEDEKAQKRLFRDITRALARSSLINCSMNPAQDEGIEAARDNGLIVGHAYTLTRAHEVRVQNSEK